MNNRFVLTAARKILRKWDRNNAELDALYERECREAAREGFAPHYCRHGVNMWVDYDMACWRCEVGEPTRTEMMRAALDAAHKYDDEMHEAADALTALAALGLDRYVNTSALLDDLYDRHIGSDAK